LGSGKVEGISTLGTFVSNDFIVRFLVVVMNMVDSHVVEYLNDVFVLHEESSIVSVLAEGYLLLEFSSPFAVIITPWTIKAIRVVWISDSIESVKNLSGAVLQFVVS